MEADKLAVRPIHVLEIAGNAIVGGMEKFVYNLAHRLPEVGVKVTCLTPFESRFTSSLRDLGCEVFTTAMDQDPPWHSIQFCVQLIRQLQIDLIHAHMPRAHVLAGLVGRLTNVPVVATVHGMDINSYELGVSRTTGTFLTVVCQAAYSQALSLGIPAEQVALISNGVDLKIYTPARSGQSFRKSLHLSPDVPLVGFVGRLAWEKGPDQFIRMAEVVKQTIPEAHFAMVGDGPMEAELRSQIKVAGLEEYVHLCGALENTWEIYPAFDVLAQTSHVEGMPLSLLEAMACGVPVIAMGVGGVPEIVEVNTTGYLSAPGDWTGLAKGVIKMLPDPEKRKQLGHSARKRVEINYDVQAKVQLMADLFRHLIHNGIQTTSTYQTGWPVRKQGHAAER